MGAKFNWKTLIPFYGLYEAGKNIQNNLQDGYNFGDIISGLYGFQRDNSNSNGVVDSAADLLNDHNVSGIPDENGLTQVETNPADPMSSASNVINYDPTKSAQENLLGYARANNSASAYATYLQNMYNEQMSNTAISRAIADAEANGISKYQLFQSGNMAASTPSSGSSAFESYESAMNRRNSYNSKELQMIATIISSTISSAFKLFK